MPRALRRTSGLLFFMEMPPATDVVKTEVAWGGWPLASLFLVWAAAAVVAYAIPSPVGHNLVRASVFVVPLMLVATALADFRPRWLTIAAVGAAVASNVLPYAAMISDRSSSIDSTVSFWRPVMAFLHANSTPGFRVEVVRESMPRHYMVVGHKD